MNELQTLQASQGATFETISGQTIAQSFGNDAAAYTAAQQGLALCDRSHWTLLRLTGDDRQQFLHNQTTNQIQLLQPGQGCETVFTNSTGRTLDLATVCTGSEALEVIASPGQGDALMTWLDRYLFPADRVELHNLTGEFALFSIWGQPDTLDGINLDSTQVGQHCQWEIAGVTVTAITGSGLSLPGYTLKVPQADAAAVWQSLTQAGAVPLGQTVWEQLRIQDGRPMPGDELTLDYNALEAGLWRAISFTKGCYIGQETIARLNTYQGVKQRLWGVQLTQAVDVGTAIEMAGKAVGQITSVSSGLVAEGAIALGYLKTKAGGIGSQVQVGTTQGTIRAVPFVSHDYYEPDSA
ncbi:MAG: folate-binding protein YgfZ [Spirulina sp. SIO3F2]|nr:folate-binding protein YgfZ [Spirulina sp. SIO3F2]